MMNRASEVPPEVESAGFRPVTSLIASLYGDCLSQRGGEVWLGSVAALLEGRQDVPATLRALMERPLRGE